MKYIIAVFLILMATSSVVAQKHLSDKTLTIVEKIEKNNTYESPFTGFAGTASSQYHNYQDLWKTPTEKELVELLHYKNAVVRVYSFKALYKKNKKLAEQHAAELLKDTTSFMTLQGCIAGSETVKNAVRRMLHPTD